MKFLEICIGAWLILALNSCVSIPLPTIEDCRVLSSVGACIDKRLPVGQQEYDKDFRQMLGYRCTSPSDIQLLMNDINSKRAELAKLRTKMKNKDK